MFFGSVLRMTQCYKQCSFPVKRTCYTQKRCS